MTLHASLAPAAAPPEVVRVPARARTPLTLGLLTPHDPFDATAFSGSARFAAQALERRPGVALHLIGDWRPRGRLSRRLFGPTPPPDPAGLRLSRLDAIIGLVATPLLEALPVDAPPFLHVTDATPAFLREAYGWPLNGAERAERLVARRAQACVYSSAAMALRAPVDLGLPGLRTHTVPFGINMEHLPRTLPAKPPLSRLELLFVGLDWQRKGGDMALATLDALRAGGRDARLTVVGGAPKGLSRHPGVRVAGFLDKRRPRAARRLAALYAEAHLLLLPTKGDCTPMVLAEAMAHGTPALATDTGGVADILGTRGTGVVMPQGAGVMDWTAAIRAVTRDFAAYTATRRRAFERAERVFSWEAWAGGLVDLAGAAVLRAQNRAAA